MQRRNTTQREIVLETVQRMKTHATADEVYAEVAKQSRPIGRATVYRNLNVLAEEGRIRKIEVPGEADRFDFTVAEHCHVKCIECKKLFDVETELLPDLCKTVKSSHGVELLRFDVLFSGVCPDCKRKRAENEKSK